MKKDFISVSDLSPAEIQGVFKLTGDLKKNRGKFSRVLSGKTLALIFQKPSNRTRVSFEVGMYQLGGHSLYLAPNEINLGVRESIKDVAKTLSRYVDAIVLRTFEHQNVCEMAKYADVPVINGLSDFSHPCQALADVFTVKEKLKVLKGKTLAYIGDGNNVCHSLLMACAKSGLSMNAATPEGYEPDKCVVRMAETVAQQTGASIRIVNDPLAAVQSVNVLYTDVWASMGQEEEAQLRKKVFKNFQINGDLVKQAKPHALVMHCLPAHRGEEITEEVLEGAHSVVFDQAENRMHVQKAILIKLLGEKK